MNKIRISILVSLATLILGCAASKPPIGTETLVETRGEKPKWVKSDETYFIKKDRINFRVFTTDESDLSFGLSQGLQGKVIEFLIPAIQMRIGMEFDEAVKGTKYSKDTIGQVRQMVTNAIGEAKIRDVLRSAEYWEKWSRNEPGNRISYFYNIYALYSIAQDEYYSAKNQSYNKAVQSANNKQAQELLDEVKERFLSKGD